LVKKRWNALS
jgi:3-phenylpropionate/trans-cinnamate dioxygenase ferredoxin component